MIFKSPLLKIQLPTNFRNYLACCFFLVLCVQFSFTQNFSDTVDEFHAKGSKTIGVSYSFGKNNTGYTANFGYTIMDNFSIHANIGKREFILKEYSEDILEGGMEGRFAYSLNDRYSGFIKGVSFSGGLGFQIESVENTSDIILIDSYPQITYITGGLYVEASLYHNLKLGVYFRQWYGVSGELKIIGKQRYDIGTGLTYYFF